MSSLESIATARLGQRRPASSEPDCCDDPDWRRQPGVVCMLCVGIGVAVHPVVGLAAGAVALLVPWWLRRRAAAARVAAISASVPAFVDLVRLGLDAGLSVRHALTGAVEHSSGPLAERIELALAHAEQGGCLADELAEARELGEPVRPLLDVLERCERYGSPTSEALARLADDGRRRVRRQAETAARRTPVLLLFPLVCCTLPAFALVTVVPVLVSTLSAISAG